MRAGSPAALEQQAEAAAAAAEEALGRHQRDLANEKFLEAAHLYQRAADASIGQGRARRNRSLANQMRHRAHG